MGVRKRVDRTGRVRWQAILVKDNTYVCSMTFDTKREASAWLADRQREYARGVGVDGRAASHPVRDVVAVWERELPGMVAESTVARDLSVFRVHVPAWLMDMRIGRVTAVDMQRVLNGVEGAPGTRRRVRIVLCSFFTWCVEHRVLPSSPMDGTKLPRGGSEGMDMHPFTWAELAQVVERMRGHSPTLADAVWFLGVTGLRWGELRVLRVRDVEEEPMLRLVVRASRSEGMAEKGPKSGRMRYVPVPPQAQEVLRRHIDGKDDDALAFTTARGHMLHKSNLRRGVHWDELARGRRLHDLRHTAATEWLRHGVDVETVRVWLGHGSLSTTQRYVHYLGTEADRIAMRKLSR